MPVRTAFAAWLPVSVVVLPLWLFVGWAIFGGSGWGVLGLVLTAPVAFVVLGVIALLVRVRPSVRESRAVSWTDLAVLGLWQASIVATGFFGATGAAFATLAVLGSVVVFWYAVAALVRDGARRAQTAFAEFQTTAGMPQDEPAPRRGFDEGDDGVIVVHEVRD